MSAPQLKDEDDFTHYFNATQRLSKENKELREALRELVAAWRRDSLTDEIAAVERARKLIETN